MKKLLSILIIAAGIALSTFWIVKDPGWTAMFHDSTVYLGFLPIPGSWYGYLCQSVPGIGGILGGIYLWKK